MMTTSSYTLVEGRTSFPGTPSHSPPPSRDGPNKLQISPATSDDSSIACDLSDLSFNYERNSRGEIVRVSKGSSKSSSTSTPPTPSDSPPKAPSPILGSLGYTRPTTLARSESLPQESLCNPRQFQRAASGSLAITPAGVPRGFSALAATNAGTGRKIGGPRRVRLDDPGEAQPKPNTQTGVTFGSEEKENLRAARLIRPARSIGRQLGADRIAESSEELEVAPPPYAVVAAAHHPIRPRRSASLSDAPPPIEPIPDRPVGHSRPGTSLGARRVTLEEKMRQEREIALEGHRREEEDRARAQANGFAPAPSPTHVAQPHLRHQRKDSDTMRNTNGSPTVVEAHRTRRSDLDSDLPKAALQPAKTAPQSHNLMPVMPNAASAAGKTFIINKKAYQRLDQIGRGGSSRVYRVMTPSHEMYAMKRVQLDKLDSDTMAGYMNEISLLKRLDGNQRIIRLYDSEVKNSPSTGGKGTLYLIMECGEIDFARLLSEQQKEIMDPVWVAYYWKQMLQAVHIIHEEKIVHSDLKPANFVLVKGQLKLIDFGIANAIANDTTNIQRDHQVGTVNYMSPEAIELQEGMRRLKVGRPSDVWSLGCILYQMVYGTPPFAAWNNPLQKMKAITDEDYVIEFPEFAVPVAHKRKDASPSDSPPQKLDHLKVRVPPNIIKTLKNCLARNPKARATIPELLQQNWLEPDPGPERPSAPSSRPLELQLGENETIINPHFMKQLLIYGLRLGLERSDVQDWTDQAIEADALRLVTELKRINRNAALGVEDEAALP
ncbi:kinase-like domain-containing protein [Daedaleopsis nitida]|nr:kinase-like domain-containing protein [Daedaleopsis nitida]